MHLCPPLCNLSPREYYMILFGAAGAMALVVGLVSAWLGAHFGARRAVRRALRDAGIPLTPVVEAQLRQLGESVDAIALEVERIAEAQRFAAKLMVERNERDRLPAAPPPREPRVITPH